MSSRLSALISYVRERSPYYRELYAALPRVLPANFSISDLPLVDSKSFWEANSLEANRLLTGSMSEGIIFKSGGTSGAPKFSVFTQAEWNSFCASFGQGMRLGGVKDGERVANLFYVGELYASFIFIMKSLELATKTMQLPIAGATEISKMVSQLKELSATTVAGTPSTMVQIAEYVQSHNLDLSNVNKFLFGGEHLYDDQRDFLKRVFPHALIQSIGYASVDAGLLGFADNTCLSCEHRSFGEETVYEIIDNETHEVITELGRVGKAYITYLDRRLMPIIRYPVGDQAMWVEDAHRLDRKFKLVGRSEEAARVGPVSLFYDDLFELFSQDPFQLSGLQILITHADQKDQLTLRVVTQNNIASDVFLKVLLRERSMIADEVAKGHIHLPRIEVLNFDQLERNPRTGKMMRVIDRRS